MYADPAPLRVLGGVGPVRRLRQVARMQASSAAGTTVSIADASSASRRALTNDPVRTTVRTGSFVGDQETGGGTSVTDGMCSHVRPGASGNG